MAATESHEPSAWTWQSQASCRGTDADLFFPSLEDDPSAAKAICEACPVRLACLGFALEHSEKFGVWGGMTERERTRLTPAEREDLVHAGRRAREATAA